MPKMLNENWLLKEERDTLWCKGCTAHLPRTEFAIEGRTTSGNLKFRARCKKCHYKHAMSKHKSLQLKNQLVEYVQINKIKCYVCGYDKCKAALDFHHLIEDTKEYEISDLVWGRKAPTNTTYEILKNEVSKCVVLCSNCHREYHAGMIDLIRVE